MKNDISASSSIYGKVISSSYMKNPVSITPYDEVESTVFEHSHYSEVNSAQQSEIFAVAQWFINQEPMTHKKLQKLCYYAYAWFLVFFNDPETHSNQFNTLCPDGFEAWVHGPVSPELYRRYRVFGWNDIPAVEEKPSFSSDMEDLLNQVWNTYGHFTADQLEQLSHNEAPWQEARNGKDQDEPSHNKISEKRIINYYSKMMEA